jgi:hypothetical protein
MSRGRPRHHSSRRRAYRTRQREVRERRLQVAPDDVDVSADEVADLESPADGPNPDWTLHLQGRPAAA